MRASWPLVDIRLPKRWPLCAPKFNQGILERGAHDGQRFGSRISTRGHDARIQQHEEKWAGIKHWYIKLCGHSTELYQHSTEYATFVCKDPLREYAGEIDVTVACQGPAHSSAIEHRRVRDDGRVIHPVVTPRGIEIACAAVSESHFCGVNHVLNGVVESAKN